MDWDNVRVFLAVARGGQFVAAAKRLKLDPATVSRRIAALEETIGAKLFDRRTTGAKLTDAGERLISAAEQMESAFLDAHSEISGVDLKPTGNMSIGAPEPMDWNKTISDFLIVTIPGVLLYFMGWAYLYYYLQSFGIYPSELKLDTMTVLIYSYTPISDFISTHWVVVVLWITVVLTIIHLKFNWREPLVALMPRLPKVVGNLSKYYRPAVDLSPFVRTVYFSFVCLIGIIFVLYFVLVPISHWTAERKVKEAWSPKSSATIRVNLQQRNAAAEDKMVESSFNGNATEGDDQPGSSLVSQEKSCQDTESLIRIFSDDSTLFTLCVDKYHIGRVFELRKEKGVISARDVYPVENTFIRPNGGGAQ